ncbi:glycosyl transferase [Levilactobacillus zymae]|uniref:Glycosyl transferase n=1 Tax=Levilactobacillus zymae TaxID=267363 RepID=A0ABQ0WX23_9LACO|nr:glycosyltransferase family 8 protein [Levilactobacillus zymae]KRL13183.1 Exopolysaccharide glycosyltransferase [Levilactobacillus zymae DSM 19395]QFR61196.1 glycosyltransferase family 8 protein [Levilactobacillus zymae]GEO72193.1 glycosyl transferase [Levilactobacillus zymae]
MAFNLLFAVDDHFVDRMLTTLYSLRQTTATTDPIHVYVIQDRPFAQADRVTHILTSLNMTYHPVIVDETLFADAPLSDRYPKSIYYRLLASDLLPATVDKVLYLDADILVINDFTPFYQTDLSQNLYAAAMHTDFFNLTGTVNQYRLATNTPHYFNSGVLLINLARARQVVDAAKIFAIIRDHHDELLLPDQDVLNKLYADDTLAVPDVIYNYDVRKNLTYQATSQGKWDLNWVVANTVFLHFCGTKKPWLPGATDRFAFLYKHYQHRLEFSLS